MQVITESRDIKIRKLKFEPVDFNLLTKWLKDPQVLQYYEGRDKPHDLEKVKQHYGEKELAKEKITACIIEFKNKPIGYMQYYPLLKKADYELADIEGIWAVDMYIGLPEYWNRGIGSSALNLLSDYLLTQEETKAVVIDPHADNQRAIMAYEKAGFKKVKILKKHEIHEGKKVDSWLMKKSTT